MSEAVEQVTKHIVFKLDTEYYGIPVESVGSIERVQKITRVPNTKPYMKGVMNLRGIITPIIDLRKKFGLESIDFDDQTRILIVQLQDMTVGFIVDEANDVIDLGSSTIEPPPEAFNSTHVDYIKGVTKENNRLIVLLDLEKVLHEEEELASNQS
ncbi:chemotaxis protein CheW [Aquisalibacillus elongatus]|uniref:Chemotaxis protein CheW n=1 Tax=Aquisalibacillus elongatus TaxID=485577 RepID=A0A3N5BE28_9BACI|nr:chemotaxis protein CheW [Aquisalibacillus elongatus]RPF55974.1 purine-binding chemotaxis protein CheW [Aquisalibacillus elongatus]